MPIFLTLETIASPTSLFLTSDSELKQITLLVCFWLKVIKDSFLHPIFLLTNSRFFKTFSFLSADPKPQFKLS